MKWEWYWVKGGDAWCALRYSSSIPIAATHLIRSFVYPLPQPVTSPPLVDDDDETKRERVGRRQWQWQWQHVTAEEMRFRDFEREGIRESFAARQTVARGRQMGRGPSNAGLQLSLAAGLRRARNCFSRQEATHRPPARPAPRKCAEHAQNNDISNS